MVVSFMGTLCVLWLIVRFMVAAVRFMVNCAFYGYCAFYGLYNSKSNFQYVWSTFETLRIFLFVLQVMNDQLIGLLAINRSHFKDIS